MKRLLRNIVGPSYESRPQATLACRGFDDRGLALLNALMDRVDPQLLIDWGCEVLGRADVV